MNDLSMAAEALERAELEEFHAAAGPELTASAGLRLEKIDGALASVVPGGGIVLNRVLGLGLAHPADPGTPARLLRLYAEAGVERFFLNLHPNARPPDLAQQAQASGFAPARGWRKFRRPAGPVSPRQTSLKIREIDERHSEDFGRIAAAAFDVGPHLSPAIARLVGRPGWHVFMSFDGEEPAGAGALFIRDGLGWTDWGATRPEFRQRGSQGALLARRIEAANEAGCEWVMTCTGEAVPGDAQHSYGNILKAGFEEWTLRPNLAPA